MVERIRTIPPLTSPKIIGYLRVSTILQDLENQRLEILRAANDRDWNGKVDFVEETVSGRVSYKKRKLGSLLDELKQGDVLIVSELSRLGRSLLEVLEILKTATEKGIEVYGVKEARILNGTTIESKVLSTMYAMFAEIERDLLSKRTKEALWAKKQQGVKLGRPKGIPGRSKLDGKLEEIKKLWKKKVGVAALARVYNCSWPTMKNFIEKKVKKVEVNHE